MQKDKKIKDGVVESFSTKVSEDFYVDLVKMGLGKNEKRVVDEYFDKEDKILDLGCGTGRIVQGLYKLGYTNVMGLDLVPKMIELAKKLSLEKNIEFIQGDATNLEMSDNCFDKIIFGYNGWSQIPGETNRQKALNEVYRTLKQEGVFVFTALVFNRSILNYSRYCKYLFSKIVHLKNWEMEFGDVYLYRYEDFDKKFFRILPRFLSKNQVMKIFVHYYPSQKHLFKILQETQFEIIEFKETYTSRNYSQYQIVLQK